MRRILFLMFLALVLGACMGNPKPTDPLVPIETNVGREFKLVIESNPSTGYHWETTGEPDDGVVQFVSRDYKHGASKALGAGGVDIWVFKAVGTGETTVTLGWFPPSNTPTEPVQIETFTIRVK